MDTSDPVMLMKELRGKDCTYGNVPFCECVHLRARVAVPEVKSQREALALMGLLEKIAAERNALQEALRCAHVVVEESRARAEKAEKRVAELEAEAAERWKP